MTLDTNFNVPAPDGWEETDARPQSDLSTNTTLLAHYEHEQGEHRIEAYHKPRGAYVVRWYTQSQSMRREPESNWGIERSEPYPKKLDAEATAALLMDTIATMEDRADHQVRRALDGPSDY